MLLVNYMIIAISVGGNWYNSITLFIMDEIKNNKNDYKTLSNSLSLVLANVRDESRATALL